MTRVWQRKDVWSYISYLSQKSLLNQDPNLGIKRLNPCTNTLAQLAWSKMNIQARCLCTFMPSYQSNLIEADPCSFEDGTALVAQGVWVRKGKPTFSRTRSTISSKAPTARGQPGLRVDSDTKIWPRSSPS